MQQKAKLRFLKKITVLCLVMNALITLAALAVGVLSRALDAGVVGVLAGMWSIELALGYLIKRGEKDE